MLNILEDKMRKPILKLNKPLLITIFIFLAVILLFPCLVLANDLPPIPEIPSFPTITSNRNTYHVDKDIGSDIYSNEQAQNPATPWATIRHGVNQLSAGDTLIVHEAESAYKVNTSGEHDMIMSGTETNWITIKGADGERPVISTDYTSSCQSDCPRGFRFRSTARYIYVTNFDMAGFIYIGIRFDPGSEHIVIDDIYMDSIDAIGVEIGDHSDPTGAKHLYLREITVTNSGYRDEDKRGAFVIYERSEDIVFEKCIAIDSQSSGFRVYGWKGSNPAPLPYDPADSVKDLYLIGCESHSGGSTQANFTKVYNLVVKDCIFANGMDHGEFTGLKFWGKELWLINSVLDNNYLGLELLPCYGDADIYVLHNTFIDNKWSSIRKKGYRYIESEPGYFYDAANMYLYNNIFMVKSNQYHSSPYCCFATEHTNGNIVESNNNLFFGQDNERLFGFYQWVSEPYNRTLLKSFYMWDVNDAGTGDWQTDTTYGPSNSDNNSISRYALLDSDFTNMAGNDYLLYEGSLSIDAGVDIGITNDIIGIERPQGSAPDIGAYEYEQSAMAPPQNLVVVH